MGADGATDVNQRVERRNGGITRGSREGLRDKEGARGVWKTDAEREEENRGGNVEH